MRPCRLWSSCAASNAESRCRYLPHWRPRMNSKVGKGAFNALITVLTWLGALAMFAPIAWMVLTSFKSEQDAVSSPPLLFFKPTLEHYRRIFDNEFASFAINSVLATGI